MKFELTVVTSGSGESHSAGRFPTLEACWRRVEAIEEIWRVWCDVGCPELDPSAIEQYYEGCDVYARDLETGRLHLLGEETADGGVKWEIMCDISLHDRSRGAYRCDGHEILFKHDDEGWPDACPKAEVR